MNSGAEDFANQSIDGDLFVVTSTTTNGLKLFIQAHSIQSERRRSDFVTRRNEIWSSMFQILNVTGVACGRSIIGKHDGSLNRTSRAGLQCRLGPQIEMERSRECRTVNRVPGEPRLRSLAVAHIRTCHWRFRKALENARGVRPASSGLPRIPPSWFCARSGNNHGQRESRTIAGNLDRSRCIWFPNDRHRPQRIERTLRWNWLKRSLDSAPVENHRRRQRRSPVEPNTRRWFLRHIRIQKLGQNGLIRRAANEQVHAQPNQNPTVCRQTNSVGPNVRLC